MANLIKENNKHIEKGKEHQKVKRSLLIHEVECRECGSIAEYTSADREKNGHITCENENCKHKLKTAWGEDEEIVERGGYVLTTN